MNKKTLTLEANDFKFLIEFLEFSMASLEWMTITSSGNPYEQTLGNLRKILKLVKLGEKKR